MKFRKAIVDYLEYLEIELNRSQKTISNYDHYLNRLIDFAGDINVSEIDPEMVRKWRLWLNRLGSDRADELSKTTQNYHLIALRNFLKYQNKLGHQVLSSDKVELAKTKRKQINFLNQDEVNRLLAAPKADDLSGLRDKAILELLYSSG